jgi:hypothetical protein
MHSEPTKHPAQLTRKATLRGRKLAIAALCVLTIAGCAEGTARDAERGRERDAERTSVVDSLQSTRTSEIILGTPDASPTATP